MTKIYDINGTKKDAAWLAANYDGCQVLKATIPAGTTEYWALAAVYCTTGPAALKAEVRRSATIPADNQGVAMSYPKLNDPNKQLLEPLPPSPHNWTTHAVAQRTETNGITGFGLGEVYGPFYHAWVISSVPSDCLSKCGMKGGTNHEGPLHGVWILSPVVPEFATVKQAALWHAEQHLVMPLNPQAALQKAILTAGMVPNSPEYDFDFGGKRYIGQRAERLSDGKVSAYFVERDKWGTIYHADRP